MRWVLAMTTAVGVITLARVFFVHARSIMRDVNERFDAVENRLQQSANSLVDNLLNTRRVADSDSGRD